MYAIRGSERTGCGVLALQVCGPGSSGHRGAQLAGNALDFIPSHAPRPQACDIDIVDSIDPDELLLRYVIARRPVLLRGVAKNTKLREHFKRAEIVQRCVLRRDLFCAARCTRADCTCCTVAGSDVTGGQVRQVFVACRGRAEGGRDGDVREGEVCGEAARFCGQHVCGCSRVVAG